ncbi:hypothetical protein Lal_00039793 [Lupinus albus]|nr:hypothetical protein Lal_00039793 [Lupinus albus]
MEFYSKVMTRVVSKFSENEKENFYSKVRARVVSKFSEIGKEVYDQCLNLILTHSSAKSCSINGQVTDQTEQPDPGTQSHVTEMVGPVTSQNPASDRDFQQVMTETHWTMAKDKLANPDREYRSFFFILLLPKSLSLSPLLSSLRSMELELLHNRDKVLRSDLWIIFNQYVAITNWSPEFNSTTTIVYAIGCYTSEEEY